MLLAALLLLLVSGCGSTSIVVSQPLTGGQDIGGKTIEFLIDSPPNSPWPETLSGVEAAEAATGVTVRVAYADDGPSMAAEIEASTAANVAGIAIDVATPATDAAICAARQAGIPVVAWNNNGYGPAGARCVMAFIGEDSVSAGRLIATYMAGHGYIRPGAQVFCPVEDPTSAYAKQRALGVNSVLASFGTRCNVLGAGFSLNDEPALLAYLREHPATSLVMALGATPLANMPAALKQFGRHIPVAGFDLSDGTTRIITGIEQGDIVATVDQQYYLQGFYAVMQLALYLKYGLLPSSVNTSQNSVVDNSSVGLVADLTPTYR